MNATVVATSTWALEAADSALAAGSCVGGAEPQLIRIADARMVNPVVRITNSSNCRVARIAGTVYSAGGSGNGIFDPRPQFGAPTVSTSIVRFLQSVAENSGAKLRAPTVSEGFPL